MSVKVVIATHPKYDKALDNCLRSLNWTRHTRDIIICVAGVSVKDAPDAVRAVQDRYLVPAVHACPLNLYEYTSFVTLDRALGGSRSDEGGDGSLYFMMHDTCEGGYRFWSRLRECAALCAARAGAGKGWWFPACDNFNIGFATRGFVRAMARVYERATMNKVQAIQAEVYDNHPLSLRRHAGGAGGAWAYADPDRRDMYTNYANDTDAYGTGHARCVGYLHAVDLKKYFTFDPHWQQNGARLVPDAP